MPALASGLMGSPCRGYTARAMFSPEVSVSQTAPARSPETSARSRTSMASVGARAIREPPQRPDGHVGRGQGDAADAPGASQRRLHGVGPERHFRPSSA
jgi:hypothetical protein